MGLRGGRSDKSHFQATESEEYIVERKEGRDLGEREKQDSFEWS